MLRAASGLRLSLCGSELRGSVQVRFLGYILDPGLSWIPHIEKRCTVAKRLIFGYRRFLGLIWGLNQPRLETLYLAVIEPVLLYGCSLWCSASRSKRARTKLRSVQGLYNIMLVRALSSTSSISLNLQTKHIPVDYYQHRFSFSSSSLCHCGEDEESITHFLFFCKLFTLYRSQFISAFLSSIPVWPPDLSSLPLHPNVWQSLICFVLKTARLNSY